MKYDIHLEIDDTKPDHPEFAKIDVKDLKTGVEISVVIKNFDKLDESIIQGWQMAQGMIQSFVNQKG